MFFLHYPLVPQVNAFDEKFVITSLCSSGHGVGRQIMQSYSVPEERIVLVYEIAEHQTFRRNVEPLSILWFYPEKCPSGTFDKVQPVKYYKSVFFLAYPFYGSTTSTGPVLRTAMQPCPKNKLRLLQLINQIQIMCYSFFLCNLITRIRMPDDTHSGIIS